MSLLTYVCLYLLGNHKLVMGALATSVGQFFCLVCIAMQTIAVILSLASLTVSQHAPNNLPITLPCGNDGEQVDTLMFGEVSGHLTRAMYVKCTLNGRHTFEYDVKRISTSGMCIFSLKGVTSGGLQDVIYCSLSYLFRKPPSPAFDKLRIS